MLELSLFMAFTAFFLQFIPVFNFVHIIFKKGFYETMFFSVIVYYFLSPIAVNLLIFFNVFNQVFMISFFGILTAVSFIINRELIKKWRILAVPAVLFLLNSVLNFAGQSLFFIILCVFLFSLALVYLLKPEKHEIIFVFVLLFFFSLSVLTTGFSFGDIYHYIFSAQSIEAGRYTFVDSHAGNEFMFHAFLQQAFFALVAKTAGIDIVSILPLGYFFGTAFIAVYFLKKIREFEINSLEKWVIALLVLVAMELEFRSRLVGVTMIVYLILEFHSRKNLDFYDKLRFTLACACVSLTHISLFVILCCYLLVMLLVSIRHRHKDFAKTALIALLVSAVYSSMWWLPLYLRYEMKVNSFWETATIETSTVGLFLNEAGLSNIVFLLINAVCLAFLFRDFSSISMTAMPAVLLAFGFHPIITGFLKKAFIPTSFSAATVPYFVPIGAAAILKAFESIKIKIEKTEISRKHVSIIILAVFLPEMFNFLSYMSGKYAELKNGLPWNNELKVFTQEQANLEAYKWTLENTDKEDVILCPDEYVQTNEGLRMYDRNSLLVAVVTGRRPYVLNHNYASYMVNSHERYQYANFILYSANDTERYYMAKYINLSYIAVDKIKDKEFKEFYGLENIFENSKYLIYKVM